MRRDDAVEVESWNIDARRQCRGRHGHGVATGSDQARRALRRTAGKSIPAAAATGIAPVADVYRRRQIFKEVEAVDRSNGDRDGGQSDVLDTVAVQVSHQGDCDTVQARFAGLLKTVGVGIVPDAIADGADAGVAKVCVVEVLASAKGDRQGLVARGQKDSDRYRRLIDVYEVVTGRQSQEVVGARAVGELGRKDDIVGSPEATVRAGLGEIHRDAPDPRLASALDAVDTEIEPYEIADAAAALISKIVGQDVVRRHRVVESVPTAGAGETFQRPAGIEIRGGYPDHEGPGIDLEAVVPVRVGGRRSQDVAGVVEELDKDSGNPGIGPILNPVSIGVEEHRVTDHEGT